MTLYGLDNLPYGVFSVDGGRRRIGVRVHDDVLDLDAAEAAGLIDARGALRTPTLNAHMAQGRAAWSAVRARVRELARAGDGTLVPLADCELHLPFQVADYVDFYSSAWHASNVGKILRPNQPDIPENWWHLPIGYHGRAGTVTVSGTPIVRPWGQRRGDGGPAFGPSTRLDIEAEVGFVVGTPTRLGTRVPVSGLADHVFGVVLVNDWSARDIQAWEYVPLGPFCGKSFATSVAPWVVPLEALAHAWTPAPAQDPPVLDYLRADEHLGLDLSLAVEWNGTRVSRPPFAGMYWTPAQQLAHLTVNGASLCTGDLFASGTVSGPQREEVGSFLELTAAGPVRLADGSLRTFLEDGDTVSITATAPGPDGTTIGFGEVTGTVVKTA
ncbi:fumarylacetoacetase [Spirilliplanes yamanashiensis]|uniref:fumarylacetoacetase n=1 Tax=Spirilliplanes yamanashiensis TaxID=42233 RepID=A0A8J4DIH9_9ACTN|nr:fumarylacetoacetase [Spirilliplanes yamanashiensis]MDP9814536.1 fumarylacetoacetase [Spirilliplanes yamanashiensis]GIJ02188.1 fumarylacetoacetase [Spirilliplanes yamanashiensis]